MVANTLYLFALTYKNKKSILIGAIGSSILWILYSVFVNSYVTIVTESILIISNCIQLIKLKK